MRIVLPLFPCLNLKSFYSTLMKTDTLLPTLMEDFTEKEKENEMSIQTSLMRQFSRLSLDSEPVHTRFFPETEEDEDEDEEEEEISEEFMEDEDERVEEGPRRGTQGIQLQIGDRIIFLRRSFAQMFLPHDVTSTTSSPEETFQVARYYLQCIVSVLGIADQLHEITGSYSVLNLFNTVEAQEELQNVLTGKSHRGRVSMYQSCVTDWIEAHGQRSVSDVLQTLPRNFFSGQWGIQSCSALLGKSTYYYCFLGLVQLGLRGARELAPEVQYKISTSDSHFSVLNGSSLILQRPGTGNGEGAISPVTLPPTESTTTKKVVKMKKNKPKKRKTTTRMRGEPPSSTPIVPVAAASSTGIGTSSSSLMHRFRNIEEGQGQGQGQGQTQNTVANALATSPIPFNLKRIRVANWSDEDDEDEGITGPVTKASSPMAWCEEEKGIVPGRRRRRRRHRSSTNDALMTPIAINPKIGMRKRASTTELDVILYQFLGSWMFRELIGSNHYEPTAVENDLYLLRWCTITDLDTIHGNSSMFRQLTIEGKNQLSYLRHQRVHKSAFVVFASDEENWNDERTMCVCNDIRCRVRSFERAPIEIRAPWNRWNALRVKIGLPQGLIPTPVMRTDTRVLTCPGCGLQLADCSSDNNPSSSFRGHSEEASMETRMGATIQYYGSVSEKRLGLANVGPSHVPKNMGRVAQRINRETYRQTKSIHLFETFMHQAFQSGIQEIEMQYGHLVMLQRVKQLWETRLSGMHWCLAFVANKTAKSAQRKKNKNKTNAATGEENSDSEEIPHDLNILPLNAPLLRVNMTKKEIAAVGTALVRGLCLLVELESEFQVRIRTSKSGNPNGQMSSSNKRPWIWLEFPPLVAAGNNSDRHEVNAGAGGDESGRSGRSGRTTMTDQSLLTSSRTLWTPNASPISNMTPTDAFSSVVQHSPTNSTTAGAMTPHDIESPRKLINDNPCVRLFYSIEHFMFRITNMTERGDDLDHALHRYMPFTCGEIAVSAEITTSEQCMYQWGTTHLSYWAKEMFRDASMGTTDVSTQITTLTHELTDQFQTTVSNSHELQSYARSVVGLVDVFTTFQPSLASWLRHKSQLKDVVVNRAKTLSVWRPGVQPRRRQQQQRRNSVGNVALRSEPVPEKRCLDNWLESYINQWKSGSRTWLGRLKLDGYHISPSVVKLQESFGTLMKRSFASLYMLDLTIRGELPRLRRQDVAVTQLFETLMQHLVVVGYHGISSSSTKKKQPPVMKRAASASSTNSCGGGGGGDMQEMSMREILERYNVPGLRVLQKLMQHLTEVVDIGQLLYQWWSDYVQCYKEVHRLQKILFQHMVLDDVRHLLQFLGRNTFQTRENCTGKTNDSLRSLHANLAQFESRVQAVFSLPIVATQQHKMCLTWVARTDETVPRRPWALRMEHMCLLLRVPPCMIPESIRSRMMVYFTKEYGYTIRSVGYMYEEVFEAVYGPDPYKYSTYDFTEERYHTLPQEWLAVFQEFFGKTDTEKLDPCLHLESETSYALFCAMYWSLRISRPGMFKRQTAELTMLYNARMKHFHATGEWLHSMIQQSGMYLWTTMERIYKKKPSCWKTLENFWTDLLVHNQVVSTPEQARQSIPQLSMAFRRSWKANPEAMDSMDRFWDICLYMYNRMMIS